MSTTPRAGSFTPPSCPASRPSTTCARPGPMWPASGARSPTTSDKHAVFRVSKREAAGGNGMTQFGRALHELHIDILCANSAPAKGRVERSFGPLQDRLVKEMRLAGVGTIAAANAFLPAFIEGSNERFGKAPSDLVDAHRPLPPGAVLDDVFAWKEERTVTSSLSLQYDRVVFLLEETEATRALAHQRVTVIDDPDGRLAIRHNGLDLPYRTFDKVRRGSPGGGFEKKRPRAPPAPGAGVA